jgi:hypothetical protein
MTPPAKCAAVTAVAMVANSNWRGLVDGPVVAGLTRGALSFHRAGCWNRKAPEMLIFKSL